MTLRWSLVAAIALTGCERDQSQQSEPSAIAALCDAPSAPRDRAALDEWVTRNVAHPTARWLYVRYKTRSFAAQSDLYAAARKSGIGRCDLIEPAGVSAMLADVHGPAKRASDELPFITIGTERIVVSGRAVLDTSALDHRTEPFVREVREAVALSRAGVVNARVVVDRRVTADQLMKVLWAAVAGGIRDFSLIATRGNELVALPIRLPERASTSDAPLFLTIENELVRVWPMNSNEGSKEDPVYLGRQNESNARLASALEQLASHRYGSRTRTKDEQCIIFLLLRGSNAGEVLDLMSYVQFSPAGAELFPNVVLATEG